jgi:hypothetical protein
MYETRWVRGESRARGSDQHAADLFWRDLFGPRRSRRRSRGWSGEADAAELVDPVADTRLRQTIVAGLQADPSRSLGAAAFFFSVSPPRHSDPSASTARGSSPIDCMLRTIAALRGTLMRTLPGPTPAGEVKLALGDAPSAGVIELLEQTAFHYRWNIEVMVPQWRGSTGRAAVSAAIAAGRLAEVTLTSVRTLSAAATAGVSLGNPPCTLLPPDQIVWRTVGGVLHIDAGGEGRHADANNFNYTTNAWSGSHAAIPNLVCGSITRTWPIGDRMADRITVEGSPINASEIARVIKSPGTIVLVSPATYLAAHPEIMDTLRRELGKRLGSEASTPSGISTRIEIGVR